MAEEPIQIKRYPNRRFYARNTSKYVTLSEIETMIRQGHTIDVRDSQTDESLTHAVLTQIIMERQPEKMSLFPVAMLHSIVRSNDAMTDFLRDYFRHSITYLDYLQQHGTMGGGLPNPMHWVQAWLNGFRPSGGKSAAAASEESVPESTDAALAERVAELEERLRQLETANKS